MPMRNAGTGPPAAPTPAEAYAWPSRPAARKAKCIIFRSISRLGIEASSSARRPPVWLTCFGFAAHRHPDFPAKWITSGLPTIHFQKAGVVGPGDALRESLIAIH